MSNLFLMPTMKPPRIPGPAAVAAELRKESRQEERQLAGAICQAVIEEVQAERGVKWQLMISCGREAPQAAAARVLAMAVSCSAGVPTNLVARAFNRTWQTVDSARRRQTCLALGNGEARDEFIRVLSRAMERATLKAPPVGA